MTDLNSRFRAVAALMKAEAERSARHQILSAEKKARLPEIIREKEKRLKEMKAAGADQRRELEAYIRLVKPCIRVSRTGPAVRPDPDLMQDIYLRMSRIPGDPLALKLYELASGGLAWLDREESTLTREIAEYRRILSGGGAAASWPEAVERQKQILRGSDFNSVLRDAQAEYAASVSSALMYGAWQPPGADVGAPPFAVAWKQMHLLPECLPEFLRIAGAYGTKDGRMAVPQTFSSVLEIYPDDSDRTEGILKSLQAWTAHFIIRNRPLAARVFWIDAVMMSRASLGILAPLEGSSLEAFPETPGDIFSLLSRLLAMQQERKLSERLLVARGVPEILGGQCAQMLLQLVANSGSSGLRVILFHPEQSAPGRTSHDAIVCSKGLLWYAHGGKRSGCTLTAPISTLPDDAVRQLKRLAVPKKKSSRYTDYVKTDVLPARQSRADFPVTLPYGLLNGKVQTVSFWNMDFAGYLLGSAGSGKSTLLHTLIAGITSGYHPDDVELWLADMQNSSFSIYARHMPPHVKYLVLDHSVDAITAFIERIYQEHERRNGLRAAAGVESIWDLPRGDVPPRVFVIVDEFGPLSDALADYDSEKGMKCRTWLTFLLQQGRKNGFHFLFAHQNYVNGVRGLPDEAKNQIGLRLLMAAETSEKRACAAIASRTPEQDGMLNGILPHHMALRSHGQGLPEDRCMTPPAQVLYLDDGNMEKLGCTADRQRTEMKYAPKNPVVVDQNHRITFTERKEAMLADLRSCTEPGLKLYPGTPRSMDLVRRTVAQRRIKQSFLLLCDVHNSAERLEAAMEVFRAALNSARMQKTRVEIWGCEGSLLSGRLAERYGAKPGFLPSDQVPDRIRQIFDSLQRREEIPLLILIPDLPRMLAQMDDLEEENRLLGRRKPKPQAPAQEGADPALVDLVNAFRIAAPTPAKQEDSRPDLSEQFNIALQAGSRYGTVFLACADKDTALFPKPLKAEWFANRLLFRSGAADYETLKLARSLRDDRTFLYTGASDQILFTTYAFPE